MKDGETLTQAQLDMSIVSGGEDEMRNQCGSGGCC